MHRSISQRIRVALLGLFLAAASRADTVIVLREEFVAKYQSQALVNTTMTPLFLSKIHSISSSGDDGDVHIAATADSPDVLLPMVVEICNAKQHKDLVKQIRDNTGAEFPITGVWRIWCEHGGDHEFRQDAEAETPTNSAPAHAFQIHPVTKVGDTDLASTFSPIVGYTYSKAETAFHAYENGYCHLAEEDCNDTGRCVRVTLRWVPYNYTQFLIQLQHDSSDLIRPQYDSTWVFADVYALNGEALIPGSSAATGNEAEQQRKGQRKMVFIKGTPPHNTLAPLKNGDWVRVVGVPRLNLTLVKWRLEHQGDPRYPDVLEWSVPYEMIILDAKKVAAP